MGGRLGGELRGPDADRIAGFAGVRLPMDRVPGLVGETTPVPEARLEAILTTPEVDLRPAPGDRVCSISWSIDALLPQEPAPGDRLTPRSACTVMASACFPRSAPHGWPAPGSASAPSPPMASPWSAPARRPRDSTAW
ncbi:hypothetical protein SAZ11_00975 [Streptomyces sp. FXJ1.4098]|nr:hypothetical protein [Streptomyces sp. FXJ1.4098]